MYEFIEGKNVKIFCLTKYNYIIDNILTYYDTEEYEGVLFYVMLSYIEKDVYLYHNKIIFYNLEHIFSYDQVEHYFKVLIKNCIKKECLCEFWDFDILNYATFIKNIPELVKYYKFKPLRYIEYKKVDANVNKKFDLIQIGGTRDYCPYRNIVLCNLLKKSSDLLLNKHLSLFNIEQSDYSLNELYDEINSAKTVLNIPRFANSGQEQLRIGQLISMNCSVATTSFNISYLSDYVNEVDFFADNVVDVLNNIKIDENVAERFKEQTSTPEKYKEYVHSCMEKWYNYKDSYLFTVSISAIDGKSLEKTIQSIQKSNNFNRIQILIIDIGDNSVYECYTKYKHFKNIYYVNEFDKTPANSKNLGLKLAIGKYIIFASSGVLFVPLCFDDILNNINENKGYDMYVYPCIKDGVPIDLTFEHINIGPILECCVFEREKIDIKFENLACYRMIFSGVMCKRKKYMYNNPYIIGTIAITDLNASNDEDMLPEPKINNMDWIEFTRKQISEYN